MRLATPTLINCYACDDTEEYLPLPIYLAHQLAKRLAHIRKTGLIPLLRPDGKTQVTVNWREEEIHIDNIVIAAQHSPDISQEELKKKLKKEIMQAVPRKFRNSEIHVYINAAGDFIDGGPNIPFVIIMT